MHSFQNYFRYYKNVTEAILIHKFSSVNFFISTAYKNSCIPEKSIRFDLPGSSCFHNKRYSHARCDQCILKIGLIFL